MKGPSRLYPALFARMLDRLALEAEFGGFSVEWLLPHICHLVAATLDRAGVISYRAALAPRLADAYGLFHDVLDRVISSEAQRLERDLSPRGTERR